MQEFVFGQNRVLIDRGYVVFFLSTAKRGGHARSRTKLMRLAHLLLGSAAALTLGSPPALAASPSGWDYDLARPCATTQGALASQNDYTYLGIGCKTWRLVVENEVSPGASCPGPVDQSLPIGSSSGPVQFEFLDHQSELGSNYTAHQKLDLVTYPNPCGSNYFTFFGLEDIADGRGGPLPDPTALSSSHVIAYAQWAPNGMARLLAGAQFWWAGRSHILEINLASSNWASAPGSPTGTVLISQDWNGAQYVILAGSVWGLSVPADSGSHLVSIPWANLLAQVIQRGWFSPLASDRTTQAVYLANEVRGNAVADLYHTNWRTSSAP
jgi:hypothetical protein